MVGHWPWAQGRWVFNNPITAPAVFPGLIALNHVNWIIVQWVCMMLLCCRLSVAFSSASDQQLTIIRRLHDGGRLTLSVVSGSLTKSMTLSASCVLKLWFPYWIMLYRRESDAALMYVVAALTSVCLRVWRANGDHLEGYTMVGDWPWVWVFNKVDDLERQLCFEVMIPLLDNGALTRVCTMLRWCVLRWLPSGWTSS